MVSIMEIMQLCRLCLVKEQVNIPIFEDQGDIRQIFSKISACLPVKVSKEDRLPKKICDGCLYKLELLYQFWNTSVNAEKQLLAWIEETNMDANSKSNEDIKSNSQPQEHTVKQEKLEPESTNENIELSTDSHSYILQQQQLSYQLGFPFKESQGSSAGDIDAHENSDEPLSKRRRRRQATKPVPPESLDSSDNEAADSFLEMTVTKTEEESESDENLDDPDASKFVPEDADDADQPGPSGLGKGGTEAPITFATRSVITAKKTYKRDTGPPWLCKHCKTQFRTKRLLSAHKKTAHVQVPKEHLTNYFFNAESETFKCKICGLELEVKEMIQKHVLTHEEKFTCEECNMIVYSAYKYSLHLQKHNPNAGFKCPLCNYESARQSGIFVHINGVHLRKYSYKCKHCGKGFYDVVMHHEHENSHISTKSWSCIVCKKEFAYTRYLMAHQIRYHRVLTVDPTLENQCNICKKGFLVKRFLKDHMKVHNKTTIHTHLCELCGKSFKEKNGLTKHINVHAGKKPYKCGHCDKAFTRKGFLVMHERIHSGERPYTCTYCGKAFNQPTPLKRHMRNHTGERPYVCNICGRSFTAKTALNKHVVTRCG